MRMCSLWFALLAAGAVAAARAATFERHVPADPRGEVDVSNVSGAIDITGWDKPEVYVKADTRSDSTKVEVTSERGHVSIRVIGHEGGISLFGGLIGSGGAARLHVEVPRGSELDVSAVSADVTSRGMLGTQRLQSVSGDITADVSGVDADVKSVSGDIQLRGNAQPGHFHVSSVSGDVSLQNSAGDLDATTTSGEISADLSPAGSVRLHTTSGDLTVTGRVGSGGTVEAQTVSGDATVRAGAQNGYEYEVRTFSGDIDDCFGKPAERTSRYGPGKSLMGRLGSGGARLRINTLSGDVSLCDH